MKSFWAWCAAGSVIALAGCGGNPPAETDNGAGGNSSTAPSTSTAPAGQTKLNGAGATFPYPIYSKWFEAYKAKTGVEINYQAIGSGGGIKALMGNTVDFGASDAALKSDEEAKMGQPVVHIPTVGGAVAIAYNLPGVPTGLHLTGSVLADIYLGKVTKWNDNAIAGLNPTAKLPNLPITVAHRSDGSGTTNIFTLYLKAISPDWAAKVGSGKEVKWPVGVGGKGTAAVAAAVKQNPGGIGYIELAYTMSNNMPVASLQNQAGQFVAPSIDGTVAAISASLPALQKDVKAPIVNAAGATSYPICGLTFILVYKAQTDPVRGQALVGFLKWAMADGQGMAKQLEYAPLPAEVAAINGTTIDSITTGK